MRDMRLDESWTGRIWDHHTGMQRHPVAMRIDLFFTFLLSDLTMKTTSYSCQTYHHISYVHIHKLHKKKYI